MEYKLELILSSDIFKGIPFDKYEPNFTFIVNGKEFRTSRFLADLISPKIRQYHLIDEPLDVFTLNLNDDNSNLTFSDFLKIISFGKVEITQEELKYCIQILFLLGNREIVNKFFSFMKQDITLSNVFERILYKEKYIEQAMTANKQENDINYLPEEPFQEEIDFLSTHFSELDQQKLKNLQIPLIERVISNPRLLLNNEDSLFQFITSLYIENPTVSFLYEHVNFLNISQDCINEFYEKFDVNDINHSIWDKLSRRLISAQKVSNELGRKEKEDKEKEEHPEDRIRLRFLFSTGRSIYVICNQTDRMQTLYKIASEDENVNEYQIELAHEGRKLDRNKLIGSFHLPRDAKITVMSSAPAG